MAKGKLVRVCILYIVAAAAVGGSFYVSIIYCLWLQVNTRSSLYNNIHLVSGENLPVPRGKES